MMRIIWAIVSLMILGALSAQAAPAPVIYELSNYNPWYQGGIGLTIWGANLTGTSRVTIGGNPVTALTVVDDHTITCLSPKQAPFVPLAMGDVVLTAPGGTITLPNAVQFMPPVGPGGQTKTVGPDWVVMVEATVAATPPAITLKWPVESRATGYVISRKSRAEHAWVQVGTAVGNATAWTDTKVAVGQAYEYEVMRTTDIPVSAFSGLTTLTTLTSYGYIYSGIVVPPVDHRGTVILIVDKTVAGPCSAELTLLQEDLIGDGWSVIRHDVARGSLTSLTGPLPYDAAGVRAVKQLIKTDYRNNPADVNAVLLFGHVPVPYSGNYAATGHSPEHKGAFPADVYYGDMDDDYWTDTVVKTQESYGKWTSCWNVPGDGKFDQSYVPTEVELEVGRIDLWGMGGWGTSEIAQLKQYVMKDHNHRHAVKVFPRRALIEEDHGSSLERSRSGWGSWPSLVGIDNVTAGAFLKNIIANKEEYLGYHLIGGGDNDRSGQLFSSHFYQNDPHAAFYMTWGSHHGDWDHPGNFLRAPLGSATGGLTNMYGWWPTCFLHTMGLGGTVGEAIRLRQNNITTYQPFDRYSGGVHIALMGDPTLRLFAVKPPSALTITTDTAQHPVLSWQASTDTAPVRYYVYRGADPQGPFTRVTPTAITQTSWTDTSITSGTVTYQVKAAKLETTASGSYVNTSQAVTGTVTAAGNPAGAVANRATPPPVAHADGPGTIHQLEPAAVNEGDTGLTNLTITCIRTGGSTGQVDLQYETIPFARGRQLDPKGATRPAILGLDFQPAQGTLTWADGDTTPKSFTIHVYGNRTKELDKFITIRYHTTGGAATYYPETGNNYIINDDK